MKQTLHKKYYIGNECGHHHDSEVNKIFGFWIYLMSDCSLFATLFATYAVIVNNTAGGPTGKEIFELPFVLIETVLLLLSSITYSMAVISMNNHSKNSVNHWLKLTFLFGLSFVIMETYELYHLINKGFGPYRSGFLSGLFALVGAHVLHVAFGLLWILVLIIQIMKKGLSYNNCTRVICLSLFWHFLDIIWICIFTVVYLMGAI